MRMSGGLSLINLMASRHSSGWKVVSGEVGGHRNHASAPRVRRELRRAQVASSALERV